MTEPALEQVVFEWGAYANEETGDEYGWWGHLPGTPVIACCANETISDAVDEMVTMLRAYASDWHEDQRAGRVVADTSRLVAQIDAMTDEQIREHLMKSAPGDSDERRQP